MNLTNLNENKWNSLNILLEDIKINYDYKIIEKTIIPVIFSKDGNTYLSILNTIWFKETSTNSLIDLNIYFYLENEKPMFFIDIEDKILRNEINVSVLFANILLVDKKLKNKENLKNFINEFVINFANNIKISSASSFKKVEFSEKENLTLTLFKTYLNKYLENGNLNKSYLKKNMEYYNNLFYNKDFSKEEYLTYISDFNKNFYLTLSREDKKIKEIVNKFDYSIDSVIERTAFKNRQLLIYGEKGTGKTFSIRKFVDRNNYELINIAGNSSVDELYLKGHLIRDYDGNFKWKYGKLSLAFKRAQTKKTVVFIDELLRLPEETFNMLITAMDPYEGYYYIDTGKPLETSEDIIETEEIKVPISNLWFVCATNMGNNYNVEELESAFKDRFILYHLNMSMKEKLKIIDNLINKKGFLSSRDKLKEFFISMDKLYTTGNLPEKINLRHISDIILMSDTEDEIPYIIRDKILIWVDNDLKGNPIKEQVDLIKKNINKIWNLTI